MSDKGHVITTHAERVELPEHMSPIVSAGMRMLANAPNPEALRELLAVQREWEREEARKAFERSMVALKRDMPTVLGRDKLVDYTGKAGGRTRYTHTSLAAAMEAVTESLTAHGFSLAWSPTTNDKGQVSVTCCLTHTEGHHKETTISAPADTSGNKNPAQAVASTITLLQRYTALSLLGIATADMEEPPPTAEPHGDATPKPNPDRALRAVGKLSKMGIPREDAEGYLAKPVQQWTDADIDSLAEWAKKKPSQRQPGED